MGRPRKAFPDYPKKAHASGRAVIRVGGKDVYLAGQFNSDESREDYERKRAECFYAQRTPAAPITSAGNLTVGEVAHEYLRAMELDQRPKEFHRTKTAMRLLVDCYRVLPATTFGAAELEAVGRAALGERPCAFCKNGKRGEKPCKTCAGTGKQRWARFYVNRLLATIKACWDWAVKMRMVPVSPLRSVRGIRKGLPGAREKPPVRAAKLDDVRKAQAHAGQILRDMMELQYLACMRPEEVCGVRWADIATDGVVPEVGKLPGVWALDCPDTYNKNGWRNQARVILFGPKAKCLLERYRHRPKEQAIFSPREAAEADLVARSRRVHFRHDRAPGEGYLVSSYSHAVKAACERAGVALTPLQIRHLRATEVRSKFGRDATRVVLGHHLPGVTGRYAEADIEKAAKVMRKMG